MAREARPDFWHVRAKRAFLGSHYVVVLIPGTNSVPLNSGNNIRYKILPLYSGTNWRAKRAPIFGMCVRSARVLGTPLYCGVVLIPGTN